MMKKALLLVVLHAFFLLPVSGQIDDFAWSDFNKAGNSFQEKITGNRFDIDILISPNHFYHSSWLKGSLFTVNGEVIEGYNLRYDAFRDELVAYNNSVNAMFVVDRQQIAGFSVETPEGRISEFRKLSRGGDPRRESFYEVVHEGNILLLCRVRVVERQTSLYKNRLGKLDNRAFDLHKQFYLIGEGLDYKVLESGRKAIFKLFPGRKRELRQLFRRNYIYNFSRENNALLIALLDREGFF